MVARGASIAKAPPSTDGRPASCRLPSHILLPQKLLSAPLPPPFATWSNSNISLLFAFYHHVASVEPSTNPIGDPTGPRSASMHKGRSSLSAGIPRVLNCSLVQSGSLAFCDLGSGVSEAPAGTLCGDGPHRYDPVKPDLAPGQVSCSPPP